MKDNTKVFEDYSVPKAVCTMALPSMLSMLINIVYNLADTFFVGQTGDSNQVAAVSVSMPLFLLFIAMGNLFGVGGCAFISRSLGEGKKDRVKTISAFCIYSAIGVGVLIGAIFLIFKNQILMLVGASENTVGLAADYLKWVAIGAPSIVLAIASSNLVRGEGAAKESMIGSVIGQITNIILDPIFILHTGDKLFGITMPFGLNMDSEVDEGTVTLSEEKTQDGKKWFWVDGDKKIPVEGKVVFTDVDFSYVPEKQVLKDINLYAKPGQKIAFVGSTGAGKTTITNLINRFYDIQDGSITYDSIDIKRIKKDDLRKSLAIVLQDTHMFTGTIMDNIRYGRLDATDEECIEASKLASAHSFIRRLPDGYNTVITGDGGNLSQGQRQLLAIARAAVADPPVMILDEATSSIDTRTELHIEHGMDRLMIGRTVFVIAHRLSTVRNSNAIMVLEHGEIIERGDHNALMALKGRYYELCTGKAKLS